jgi:hypothetical protein
MKTPALRPYNTFALALLIACSGCAHTIEESAKPLTTYLDGAETSAPKMSMGDDATLARIIAEGTQRNQVMSHFEHLTQKIGSRLTGSKRTLMANEWCRDNYIKWGLSNPRLEQWGTIGVGFTRGPSTGKLVAMERPQRRVAPGNPAAGAPATAEPELKTVRELTFTTLSWTKGTNGPVRGSVYRLPADDAALEKVRDKLAGAFILLPPPEARGMRDIRGRVSDMIKRRAEVRAKYGKGEATDNLSIMDKVALIPVAGYISTSKDERVWTGGVSGWRELTVDTVPNDLHVQVKLSDYDYINSRLTDNEPVTAEFNLQHELTPGPVPVYNTIAEIKGTEKPDEVVIISAHLDSWDGPGSQGATDNGTGTVVTLEAARILMAAGAKPKRTIRFIHWTGEEQGLLGSAGYVKMHESELSKISAVFVDDGGTNSQGGLECVAEMRDMLAAATAPVNGLFTDSATGKPLNVNIRIKDRMPRGGGSDHASFNAKGVPGFFWDEVGRADYGFGWHTQNDRMDLGIKEYLEQSATCSAITAYRLACADTLLPRAPKVAEKDDNTDAPARPRTREATPSSDGMVPVPPMK